MENLVKQLRVRFSGVEDDRRETDSIRDRRIPAQKTQSFKGDKKKSWFSRQFSGKMNEEYDEYPTALAAAAFAIKSLEDSRIQAETKAAAGPDTSTSMKTKSEDKPTKVVSKAPTESRKFSEEVPDKRVLIGGETTNENLPKKVTAPAPSLIRGPTTADEQFNSITKVGSKNAGPKKDVSAPSIKKTPTFADNNLNKTASTTPANSFPKPASSFPKPANTFPKPANTFPKPDPKPTAFPPSEIRSSGSSIPGMGNTQADVWEKTEMTKIIERYEKLNETISDWEEKKKTKAKRKMDKIEAELESKRAKAMQHYRTKVEMIDQIAGGARAQADQNRRKEEVQVKNKANRIRTTGKTPPTCFCF